MDTQSTTYSPKNSIRNPHDAFVKKVLGEKRHAMDFFKSYLPAEALAFLDLSTLKAEKDSFIDATLGSAFSDLIFSVAFKEKKEKDKQEEDKQEKAFFYILVEHKSTHDKWYKLQILKYMSLAWEKHHQDPQRVFLPPILPIVLYHGKSKWKEVNIVNLLDGDQSEFFKPFTPEFGTLLFDVRTLSQTFRHNIVLHIFLKALVSVTGPEIYTDVVEFIKMVWESDETEIVKLAFLKLLLIYLNSARPDIDEAFLTIALEKVDSGGNTNYKGKVMDIFSERFANGKAEGIKEGIKKGKKEGIKEGFLLGEQKGLQMLKEARREARRKDYETILRLHGQKFPLEFIALAVNLPELSVKAILKEGFKGMEQMYLEEKYIQ